MLSMPSTRPPKLPVARKDSTPGILIAKTCLDPFSVPMVNSENDAGLLVCHSASAAAIFIGWYLVMILPWMSPVTAVATAATRVVIAPALAALRNAVALAADAASSP